MTNNFKEIRNHFPILNQKINSKKLIYFDNASTTQKPLEVINAITNYYENYNCNVERGFYSLSSKLYNFIQEVRQDVKNFINAQDPSEIIFTSGTTEGINIVADSYGKKNIEQGNLILLSILEHHSNILPWQNLAKIKKAKINYISILNSGDLDLDHFNKEIKKKPKIVSIAYISNVLGTINDIKYVIKKSHEYGAKVLIDAAQAPSHVKIDVKNLDCDFLVFSSHKMFGPTGVGILYAKKKILEDMNPHRYGGGIVSEVNLKKFNLRDSPHKFESGTLNYAGIFGLKYAINFIKNINIVKIASYENQIKNYILENLKSIEQIKIIAEPKKQAPIISFKIDGLDDLDLALILDAHGIAIRTGYQCAQPLINFLHLNGVIRVSLSLYNTVEEIDNFIVILKRVLQKHTNKNIYNNER